MNADVGRFGAGLGSIRQLPDGDAIPPSAGIRQLSRRRTLKTVSAYPEAFWLWIVSICVNLRSSAVYRCFVWVHSRLESHELTTTPKIYFFLEELALHARD